ncbi:SWI:SNF matrix associated [Echinococcus multilocularis]|uniref:SWI:SNF matrix associated n=1 Tax=Echinococcus multilocularis TaxID=6211 RepID=A0A068Y3Z0_ECHMU|nr:SWI:SNF matrix associated [Echinococcus multilocularis]
MGEEISDYTSQCNSESFLESISIDTGTEEQPKFVVNLDTLADVPATQPSGDQNTGSPKTPSSSSAPIAPLYSPFMQIGKPKVRPRGSYKPLNEIVETRIRTYEGSDSHTKISTLQAHFPQFKRCHIDRCFTKNLLDFNKTYAELLELRNKQEEERARFKLILTPKSEKPKPSRIIPNIKSPELINMPSFRGRPARKLENKYYRRVIVGKDGSVEAAEVTERNFVRQVDPHNLLVARQRLATPKSISYPGLPGGEFNLNESAEETSKSTVAAISETSKAMGEDAAAVKTTEPDKSTSPGSIKEPTKDKEPQDRAGKSQSSNKFFRSNRLSDAELKKRDYVAKELQAAGRVTRSSAVKAEPSGGGEAPVDEANFMAGIGVISTPTQKRQGRRRTGRGSSSTRPPEEVVEEPDVSQEEPDELDDFGLRREERKALLTFFNEAPLEELNLMNGCSQKTAEVIINLRPFNTVVDLKLRLDATRYLSTSLIDACKELMQARSMFTSVLKSCEAISQRVQSRIASLLADDSVDLPKEGGDLSRNKKTGFLREQPIILHPLRQLKPYQLVGLNWLRILHDEGVNGILADEMGLGKTVQAIALLAYLYEQGERGPHLIMCPSSTVDNWQRELRNWCSQLKILVYQGTADVRKAMRLKIYECQQNDSRPDFNVLLTSYSTATSTLEDRALMKRVDFKYGIFDEAHMLKNMTTQRYKTLSSFQIQRRVLLTGTPLQNNLIELISLLAFVMPDLFAGGNADHLKRMFQLMSKSTTNPSAANIGSTDQTGDRRNADGREGTEAEDGKGASASIFLGNRSQFERERVEQAKQLLKPFCLRRLKSQVLQQLPPKTEETVRVPFTESQRIAYTNLINKFRNAQGASAADIASDVGEDEDMSAVKRQSSFLLSKGVITNGAAKRPKISILDTATGGLERSSGVERLSPFNMLMQLRKAANHELLLPGIAYSDDTLKELSVILHSDPSHSDADPALVLEDLCSLSDHQIHKVCRLYDVLNPFALPPETLVNGSGKIKWLDDNLPGMLKEGHRILIFSQFVLVLDILGEYLVNKGHKFLRMDGSTAVNDRQTLIDTFNNDETYDIFLLSTKAGGLGISLTGADVVIIHDVDFNPYNDRQAADRCHRVGQMKPVRVIRLIAEGSVEESIWQNAEEKLRLEEDVTGFDKTTATESIVMISAVDKRNGKDEGNDINEGATDTDNDEGGGGTNGDAELELQQLLQRQQGGGGGRLLLQGEIFKFLSDALSYGSSSVGGGSNACGSGGVGNVKSPRVNP